MDCYLVIKHETEQIISCGNRVDGEEIYVPQDCDQVIIGEDELYSARNTIKSLVNFMSSAGCQHRP